MLTQVDHVPKHRRQTTTAAALIPPGPSMTGTMIEPVVLSSDTPPAEVLREITLAAATADRDVHAALEMADTWGSRLPLPGTGNTRLLWEALASVAAVDLQVARTLEPHLDAAAILHELDGQDLPDGSTWGVYAAEGAGVRLAATTSPPSASAPPVAASDTPWALTGTKPWCSLAAHVSHALVTAWVGEERRLFRVGMRNPGVTVDEGPWTARGLPDVRSTAVQMNAVPATPVGDPGWYLERDGFAWGGIGVAAVWFGAAVQIARTLTARSTGTSRPPDQIAYLHVGAVDRSLHAAQAVLAQAAAQVDAGRASGSAGALLAYRVRGVVADACEEVLGRADHALGPAPLVVDDAHAARVADLHLYLRQHHAERDDAALGRLLTELPRP